MIRTATAAFLLCVAAVSTRPATAQDSVGPVPIPQRDSACAPTVSAAAHPSRPPLRVLGAGDGRARTHFGLRDTLLISGGAADGLELDQEWFVRRPSDGAVSGPSRPPIVHTAGWVRVVSLGERRSLARIVYACDAIRIGDRLDPAIWPRSVTPGPVGVPQYALAGQILFALDNRSLIAPFEYFVFGVHTEADAIIGQRLRVFRDTAAGVVDLGDAVVTDLHRGTPTATARLARTRDAVQVGDLVAPQR